MRRWNAFYVFFLLPVTVIVVLENPRNLPFLIGLGGAFPISVYAIRRSSETASRMAVILFCLSPITSFSPLDVDFIVSDRFDVCVVEPVYLGSTAKLKEEAGLIETRDFIRYRIPSWYTPLRRVLLFVVPAPFE